MIVPNTRLSRLVGALQDLADQEAQLVEAGAIDDLAMVQDRLAAVQAALPESDGSGWLRAELRGVLDQREQTRHRLAAIDRRLREEHRAVLYRRARLRELSPAYGQTGEMMRRTRLNVAA
jgi:hypothetical protein